MTTEVFKLPGRGATEVLAIMEQISPRKYFLHTQAGGDGWRVIFKDGISIEVEDPKMATWALLKLKR